MRSTACVTLFVFDATWTVTSPSFYRQQTAAHPTPTNTIQQCEQYTPPPHTVPNTMVLSRTPAHLLTQAVRVMVHDAARGFVVVDKPAGLLTVPARRHPTSANLLQLLTSTVGADVRAVHRLDLATSGLCVFATAPATESWLGDLFRSRRVAKEYDAVVCAAARPDLTPGTCGVVAAPLARHPSLRLLHAVTADGKPAETEYVVLRRSGDTAVVRFTPRSGRSHQIRVHAATAPADGGLGAPIVGDPLYPHPDPTLYPAILQAMDDPQPTADDVVLLPPRRLMLHASRLEFLEPPVVLAQPDVAALPRRARAKATRRQRHADMAVANAVTFTSPSGFSDA